LGYGPRGDIVGVSASSDLARPDQAARPNSSCCCHSGCPRGRWPACRVLPRRRASAAAWARQLGHRRRRFCRRLSRSSPLMWSISSGSGSPSQDGGAAQLAQRFGAPLARSARRNVDRLGARRPGAAMPSTAVGRLARVGGRRGGARRGDGRRRDVRRPDPADGPPGSRQPGPAGNGRSSCWADAVWVVWTAGGGRRVVMGSKVGGGSDSLARAGRGRSAVSRCRAPCAASRRGR